MRLLTIGAFARAARLTPKALRLYDESGLLPPAAVDPESGYRLYDPDQLTQARLIAELRRIGMPLAEIRTVCRLAPDAAARAVAGYWRRVMTDAAARGRLATLLVDELAERGTTMATARPTIVLHHAARCDAGAVRDSNEDAAYADDRLLAVADGMRGPGGAAASETAIGTLVSLLTGPLATGPGAPSERGGPEDGADPEDGALLAALAGAVAGADRAVRAQATAGPGSRPVSTLTALLRSGTRLALVHVGDSRAYLARGDALYQLTRDHTYVQSLVDRGRLGADEARVHPERALLARALGVGGARVEADLALRTALPGDRYLLCTDGLSAVVAPAALHAALRDADDPGQAVERLVELGYAAGAPDNIACVVADIAGRPGGPPETA